MFYVLEKYPMEFVVMLFHIAMNKLTLMADYLTSVSTALLDPELLEELIWWDISQVDFRRSPEWLGWTYLDMLCGSSSGFNASGMKLTCVWQFLSNLFAILI